MVVKIKNKKVEEKNENFIMILDRKVDKQGSSLFICFVCV